MSETKPYRPNNGSEGAWFHSTWCAKCINDAVMNGTQSYNDCNDDDLCQIIPATMFLEVDDSKYPTEWICDKDGKNPRCTAFIDLKTGLSIPPMRCPKTIDMFEELLEQEQ